MARYTFKCEHFDMYERISSTHTVEFNADTLETMFENFEMFLRGCGFVFNGQLELFEEDNLAEENDELDNSVWQKIIDQHDKDLTRKFTEETFGPILSDEQEKCAICKIPKSVMKSEKCYDANCPKTSWLNDLDSKLVSEK